HGGPSGPPRATQRTGFARSVKPPSPVPRADPIFNPARVALRAWRDGMACYTLCPPMPEPHPQFPTLQVFDHPLIQHKMTYLRDRQTSFRAFRALIAQIAGLMVYEV